MKKKNEVELLRDRLVYLLEENTRLKRTLSLKLPTHYRIMQTENLPENVQKLVVQLLHANSKVTTEEIPIKQRSYCVVDASISTFPIVFVSPGFESLTGYSKSECIGKNCKFLQGRETDPTEVRIFSISYSSYTKYLFKY